ncbi:hypothetical protein BJ170DRAFT_661105 [Xylariales sp. AK1849]|nr:hypothetical protein BJ170DRAFT_661105 [Xylariales sp. AK1849]
MAIPAVPTGAVPPPPGVIPDFVHPEDAGRTATQAGLCTCITLVTVFFMIRWYAKVSMGSRVVVEDWTCSLAWAAIIMFISSLFMMGHFGKGYHEWEVTEDAYAQLRKWLYIRSVIYDPASYFTKATLLLIIARVFAVKARVEKAIYFYIWVLLLCFLPLLIMKIVICTPISAYWNSSVENAQCLNQRCVFVASQSLALIFDLSVLITLIVLAWSLEIPLSRRIKIAALFGVGGLVTGLTCFQLYRAIVFRNSTDMTADFVALDLTTTVELTIGLICACLPSVDLLLEKMWSKEACSSVLCAGGKGAWVTKKTEKCKDHKTRGTLADTSFTHDNLHDEQLADFDVEMVMQSGKHLKMKAAEEYNPQISTANLVNGRRKGWWAADLKTKERNSHISGTDDILVGFSWGTPSHILVPDRIWDGLERGDNLGYSGNISSPRCTQHTT